MVSFIDRLTRISDGSVVNIPDLIYPGNFRDKLNTAIAEKRWSFSVDISGFYEINSTNGVF